MWRRPTAAGLDFAEALRARADADHAQQIEADQGDQARKHPADELRPNRPWDEKALGRIAVAVVGGTLVLLVAYLLRHHLGIPL